MMRIYQLDDQNASHVARLMTNIRPQWWPSYEDAYGQLTEIGESIGTIGWYMGDDAERPKGWILCRELRGYRAIELECSGYDDNGVFKLEHKLGDLFDAAVAYAKDKGYMTFKTGMSSLDFNIHGRPIGSIPEAIMSLTTDRIDYQWLLSYGFQVIGIQPNAYGEYYHLIMLAKVL